MAFTLEISGHLPEYHQNNEGWYLGNLPEYDQNNQILYPGNLLEYYQNYQVWYPGTYPSMTKTTRFDTVPTPK